MLLVVRPGAPSSVRSLLVARPGAPSSFLFLVVRPGARSSVRSLLVCFANCASPLRLSGTFQKHVLRGFIAVELTAKGSDVPWQSSVWTEFYKFGLAGVTGVVLPAIDCAGTLNPPTVCLDATVVNLMNDKLYTQKEDGDILKHLNVFLQDTRACCFKVLKPLFL